MSIEANAVSHTNLTGVHITLTQRVTQARSASLNERMGVITARDRYQQHELSECKRISLDGIFSSYPN